MPATAGRCRMPANNKVHSSAALQTHAIWQSAIGYDPYAPDQVKAGGEGGEDNAYDSFQGLLQLAKLTGSNADEARGACKKCHRVGHLTFQCRNFLTAKEDVTVPAELAGGLKNGLGKPGEVEEESDVSESEEESGDEKALAEAARARGLIPGRRGGGDKENGDKKSSSSSKKKHSKSLKKKKKEKSKKDKKKKKYSESSSDDSLSSDDDDDSDSASDSSEDDRRKRSKRDRKKRSSKSKKSSRKSRRRSSDSDESDSADSGSDSYASSEEERRRRKKRKEKKRRRD